MTTSDVNGMDGIGIHDGHWHQKACTTCFAQMCWVLRAAFATAVSERGTCAAGVVPALAELLS